MTGVCAPAAGPTATPMAPLTTAASPKSASGGPNKGRAIKLLIADENIRVIESHGELIGELTLDPSRNYQPLG